jgi:hypothetical protein
MSLTPICDLLSKKGKWTQLAYARDATDDQVTSSDPRACSWCLRGAAIKCYPSMNEQDEALIKIEEAIRQLFPHRSPSITGFNDDPRTTFPMIHQVIEHAKV